jgi:hypothetical protein
MQEGSIVFVVQAQARDYLRRRAVACGGKRGRSNASSMAPRRHFLNPKPAGRFAFDLDVRATRVHISHAKINEAFHAL